MTAVPAKHVQVVDEAISLLMSRAADSRGLSEGDLKPRVESVLGKYLFKERKQFIVFNLT